MTAPPAIGESTVVKLPNSSKESSIDDSNKSLESAAQIDNLAKQELPTVSADEDEHLNTDDRIKLDWKGHYSDDANKEIRFEARVVTGILIITFVGLLLTWRGTSFELIANGCTDCDKSTFNRYAYFYLGGQLGGILFGVKYLYKVVARGYRNLDRRLWRFFTPFLSGGLALVVGALTESGVLGLTTKVSSGASYFSLGFITGYFADSALAKMQEIADTIFGQPTRRKNPAPQKLPPTTGR